MEFKTAKLISLTSAIAGILILLPILWRFLGLSRTFFLVTGISSSIVLIILLWLLAQHISAYYRRVSSLRHTAEEIRLEYSFLRRVAGLPCKFPYEVLALATENFRHLVGRGSSASVYRGLLDDGTEIAVKLIRGIEHGDSDFQSEISVIASVQHVNLVRLLGYCLIPNGGPRHLVYEYFPNGSLASWIFGTKKCLPWPLRYTVAIDVAKALAYLHHDCRSRVLHLDVKPENILLTSGFTAVVSDFGLSKLMKRDDDSSIMTAVCGTRGYIAPEWLLEKGVTEKCDVYSYGMVLFELVGGRRNLQRSSKDDREWTYFPRVAAARLKEGGGGVVGVVDERVREGVDEGQVMNLVKVGMWCVQEEAGRRPCMARVVDMLEGRVGIEEPPETDMFIVDVLDLYQGGSGGGGGGGSTEELFRSEEQEMSSCSLATTVLSAR